jgi:hypothetical protein
MTNRTEDSLASLRQTLSDFRAAVNAGDGAGIYNILRKTLN